MAYVKQNKLCDNKDQECEKWNCRQKQQSFANPIKAYRTTHCAKANLQKLGQPIDDTDSKINKQALPKNKQDSKKQFIRLNVLMGNYGPTGKVGVSRNAFLKKQIENSVNTGGKFTKREQAFVSSMAGKSKGITQHLANRGSQQQKCKVKCQSRQQPSVMKLSYRVNDNKDYGNILVKRVDNQSDETKEVSQQIRKRTLKQKINQQQLNQKISEHQGIYKLESRQQLEAQKKLLGKAEVKQQVIRQRQGQQSSMKKEQDQVNNVRDKQQFSQVNQSKAQEVRQPKHERKIQQERLAKQREDQLQNQIQRVKERRKQRQMQKEKRQKQDQLKRQLQEKMIQEQQKKTNQQEGSVTGLMHLPQQLAHFEMQDIIMDAQVNKVLKTSFNYFPNGQAIELQRQQLRRINDSYSIVRQELHHPLANGLKHYRVEILNRIGTLIMQAQNQGFQNQNFRIIEADSRIPVPIKQIQIMKGLNKGHIEEIVKKVIVKQDQDCSVCLNIVPKGQTGRQLQCGHVFHIDCIDSWLQNNANCPSCRHNVKFGKYK